MPGQAGMTLLAPAQHVDELRAHGLLLHQFVAGLLGEGLEVAHRPASVATTLSSWPLCMSVSAFLALRIGSGQLSPRVSISLSMFMLGSSALPRRRQLDELRLVPAAAQPVGQRIARARRPALHLRRSRTACSPPVRARASLRRRATAW